MGVSAPIDIPALVFCGGEHRRLGRLASAQPKALLVAYDVPLLWRLIGQLRAAGLDRIVAATTPPLERQVRDSLDRYAAASPGSAEIRVEARAAQSRGMLYGLRELLAGSRSSRFLLCLGDIFFLGEPFPSLARLAEGATDVLVAARATVPEELARGGILTVAGDRLQRLIEPPMSGPPRGALRWSGVALAEREPALAELERLLDDPGEAPPPGELFESLRARGRDLRVLIGPDFVNVNSPDHLLLASLYARLEAEPRGAAAGPLQDAARSFREAIARGARESFR